MTEKTEAVTHTPGPWEATHRGVYNPETARFIKRTRVAMEQGGGSIPIVIFETSKGVLCAWHEREWGGCFTPLPQVERVKTGASAPDLRAQLDEARERADCLEEENRRLREALRIRPMSEAPRDGTHFLAFRSQRAGTEMFECWRHEDPRDGGYWMDFADTEPRPIGWIPLPQAWPDHGRRAK